MGITDVSKTQLIEKVAEELKNFKEIQQPEWGSFAKTGHFKEKPPTRKDWWYVRSAAILRRLNEVGPIGVSKLRKKYGGNKNRGHKPEHRYAGSGSIARKILQQLEKAGLAVQKKKETHKGRIISPKGLSLLDKASNQLKKR
ncbi:30S ribosomal protein S19e [Candidatus Woesearchaeota archaeon]|nr:30S ribosomal protein S19e [Candidatus Woesearchaeota archaeon]